MSDQGHDVTLITTPDVTYASSVLKGNSDNTTDVRGEGRSRRAGDGLNKSDGVGTDSTDLASLVAKLRMSSKDDTSTPSSRPLPTKTTPITSREHMQLLQHQFSQQNLLKAIDLATKHGQSQQQVQELVNLYVLQEQAAAHHFAQSRTPQTSDDTKSPNLGKPSSQPLVARKALAERSLNENQGSPNLRINTKGKPSDISTKAASPSSRGFASPSLRNTSVSSPLATSWRSPTTSSSSPSWRGSKLPTPIRASGNPTPTPGSTSSLTTLLARRQAGVDGTPSSTTQTPIITEEPQSPESEIPAPPSEPGQTRSDDVNSQGMLGLGLPSSVFSQKRSWTTPVSSAPMAQGNVSGGRALSHGGSVAGKITVIRQPYGPPGDAKELADLNFQAQKRKQAGQKLGVLGRRVETPASTPALS